MTKRMDVIAQAFQAGMFLSYRMRAYSPFVLSEGKVLIFSSISPAFSPMASIELSSKSWM